MRSRAVLLVAAWLIVCAALPGVALGDTSDPLRDRGEGIPTSMFGTYVRSGELLIYPFVEYYRDHDYEYKPEELGYGLDEDYRGKYEATEGLIFLGYGLTDRLAVELEAAVISAELKRAPTDASGTPPTISESGLGDVESHATWRVLPESGARPEVFMFGEVVFPHSEEKVLIGTPEVELKLGAGAIRGFSFGTVTARAAVQHEEGTTDLGEFALEYLRRVSPAWRLYAGVEGSQDELSFIPEVQWHLTDRIFAKLNLGIGLTSKATDFAPEFGVVFSAFGP